MRRHAPAPLLALVLLVVTAAPALAHASFDVQTLPAGAEQDLVLRVPLERDAVNDLVEVLVPGGFRVLACDGTAGWTCEQATTSEDDTVLTLRREPDGPGDTERFALRVAAPTQEGVYAFPTIQTYDDGEEAAWIGGADTDRPAPRIQVGDETTEVTFAGDATPHTELVDEEPARDPAESPTDSAAPDGDADGEDDGAAEDVAQDEETSPDDDGTAGTSGDGGGSSAAVLAAIAVVAGIVLTALLRRRRG